MGLGFFQSHPNDETVFREFFFQSHPNDERYFANFSFKVNVETDRGSKRRIVSAPFISRYIKLYQLIFISNQILISSEIVLLEPQICRQNCRQLSVFSNPASQSQPGRCDDRNSALKWPGGRRETYEIAFSLYFREINKRCTICLLLPRSVSTDDFERKFAKYRSSLG